MRIENHLPERNRDAGVVAGTKEERGGADVVAGTTLGQQERERQQRGEAEGTLGDREEAETKARKP